MRTGDTSLCPRSESDENETLKNRDAGKAADVGRPAGREARPRSRAILSKKPGFAVFISNKETEARKAPVSLPGVTCPRAAASGFEPGASAFRGGALNRCEVRTRRAKTVGYFNPEEYQKNHIHVHPSYRTKCCLTETQSKAQIEIRCQANHYRVGTLYGSISSASKSATFSPKHHPDLFPKFASD